MCYARSSTALSWLGILWGVLSLVTLLTAFVSNVWLFTREPIRLPNSDISTSITFKIGLWRVCPTVRRPNTSQPLPSPACSLIKYSTWDEVKHSDLGIWTSLDFTPAFITRMRLSTPFEAVGVLLMLVATMFALMGHFNSDHKTLVACGLYILGGLSLGGGLVIFASVLSDAYLDRPRRQASISTYNSSSNLFDYRYGWSFFAAGAAFIMAELAALLSISAYLRRFPTVEDMVRVMVPGAERRLRHGPAGEYLVHHRSSGSRRRQNGPPSLWSGSSMEYYGALVASDAEGIEGPLSRTAPDICTSPVRDAGSVPTSVLVCATDTTLRSGKPPPSDTTPMMHEYDTPLAGVTVPITLMRQQPLVTTKPTTAPDTMPTPFLFAQQLQRLGVAAPGTLVHQGVLGVSEGGASTSSSSSGGTTTGSCHILLVRCSLQGGRGVTARYDVRTRAFSTSSSQKRKRGCSKNEGSETEQSLKFRDTCNMNHPLGSRSTDVCPYADVEL
ncbi:uncharacterized protein LOC110838291 [Zootermopsis nevadensis]|uniref:uncharacterized protein LOC110838291 n=1 Tax=Zootermopsis nevadensis TaxID=136037 RepID=UPI000B8E36BD|nr:uncharacterized protein LOC110838291 [Zootermopsis nevadensis]